MATSRKTTTTKTPRQSKTPAQRAQEALDVASRKVERLRENVRQHETALRSLTADLDAEVARRDYLAGHPDLQQPATTTQITKEA